MKPTRSQNEKKPKEPQGFRRDGSWGEHFSPTLTEFVWSLCRQRRATDDPPWVYARAVRAAGFERAFTNLEAWAARAADCESNPALAAVPWCALTLGTSAESAVYYGGHDPNECCVTNSGRVVRKDRLVHDRAEPEHVSAERVKWLVDQIALFPDADVPPPADPPAFSEVPF